jgi:hypothetical protein
MKTLIEAVEAWIDGRIKANVNDLEGLQIRDANRVADLERKILALENATGVEDMVTLTERLDIIESTAEDALANAEEAHSIAENLDCRVDDHESRIDQIEAEDSDDVDTDAIERSVRDSVEDFIVDAVRTEIDAIDFRVIVER